MDSTTQPASREVKELVRYRNQSSVSSVVNVFRRSVERSERSRSACPERSRGDLRWLPSGRVPIFLPTLNKKVGTPVLQSQEVPLTTNGLQDQKAQKRIVKGERRIANREKHFRRR